jgi:hypothetical protein
VDLDVIAVDSRGQAVTDLASNDFQSTDGRKSQMIVFFHHIDSTRWRSASVGPNEYSNRTGAGIPHAPVILFDFLNEGFGSRGYAANEIISNLQALRTADYLCLYVLTADSRLFAVHGLRSTEEKGQSSDKASWTRQIKSLMNEAMRAVTVLRPFDINVAV